MDEGSSHHTPRPRSFRCASCGLPHELEGNPERRCEYSSQEGATSRTVLDSLRPQVRVTARVLDGRYEIVRELGAGAFGIVYECHDRELDRRVALKLGPDPDAAVVTHRRFLREAEMMAEVSGPGTVLVYEYGSFRSSGNTYIAMECLEGEPLVERMRRAGPLSVIETRDIAGEMLLTLATFHDRGVVHRDIKPANVFLHAPTPEQWCVKILDFGLARLQDRSNVVTTSLEIVGTPSYMAPELMRDGDVSHRSDLFALGTLMFEMLTGQPPIGRARGESVVDFLERAAAVERPRARSLRPELPRALDDVIAKALALDPWNRFDHAMEFFEALIEATGGQASLATTSRSRRLRAR